MTGGEGDFQLAGSGNCVVIEHFIKVTQAKEQQSAGHLLPDRLVLPHERC